MKTYLVSFISDDKKVAEQVAAALRKDNPAVQFSWVEKLSDGEKGWFGPIAKALREADGVVCVMASRAGAWRSARQIRLTSLGSSRIILPRRSTARRSLRD